MKLKLLITILVGCVLVLGFTASAGCIFGEDPVVGTYVHVVSDGSKAILQFENDGVIYVTALYPDNRVADGYYKTKASWVKRGDHQYESGLVIYTLSSDGYSLTMEDQSGKVVFTKYNNYVIPTPAPTTVPTPVPTPVPMSTFAPAPTPVPMSTFAPAPTSTPVPTPVPTSSTTLKDFYKLGETVHTSRFDVTVTDFMRGEKAYNTIHAGKSLVISKPSEGYEFVFFKMKFKNTGDTEKTAYFSDVAVFEDGVEQNSKYPILPDGYIDFTTTTLLPGATTSGWFVFQAPIGSEVIIRYDPSWLSSNVYFKM